MLTPSRYTTWKADSGRLGSGREWLAIMETYQTPFLRSRFGQFDKSRIATNSPTRVTRPLVFRDRCRVATTPMPEAHWVNAASSDRTNLPIQPHLEPTSGSRVNHQRCERPTTISLRRSASHLHGSTTDASMARLWYAGDWRAGRHPSPREGRRPLRNRWSKQFVK
jgi:hypothetical protein